MGRLNSDCWYVCNFMNTLLSIKIHFRLGLSFLQIFLLICRYLYTLDFPESRVISQPDQTLEILMSELDPGVMDQFYMKDGVTAKDVTRVGGFSKTSVFLDPFCISAMFFFISLCLFFRFISFFSFCRRVEFVT